MEIIIDFDDDGFNRALNEATKRGVRAVAITAHTLIQQELSVPNTGVRHKRTRATSRGRKGSQYTTYPHPSKPGEPPRLRTGFGRSHVYKEPIDGGLRWRIGVRGNAAYMGLLELGTKRVAARPWLAATLRKHLASLVKISAGAKGVSKRDLSAPDSPDEG